MKTGCALMKTLTLPLPPPSGEVARLAVTEGATVASRMKTLASLTNCVLPRLFFNSRSVFIFPIAFFVKP